jgi:hypothetical protein
MGLQGGERYTERQPYLQNPSRNRKTIAFGKKRRNKYRSMLRTSQNGYDGIKRG